MRLPHESAENKTKMEQRPLYIASCSFGKDSIATILLALEHNEPLDRAVFVEVMFDNERGISGGEPRHIEWIHTTAIPKLQAMGVRVDVVRPTIDYITSFYKVVGNKSTHPERVGKYRGWLISGRCKMNSDGKVAAIKSYYRQFGEVPIVQYVGIAQDEPKRLARLEGTNKVSLLAKYGYKEADAYALCQRYGLLSPIYENGDRDGCWFCPNAKPSMFAKLRANYPHLWAELKKLEAEPNKVSNVFGYGGTLNEIEKKMNDYDENKKQLTLF